MLLLFCCYSPYIQEGFLHLQKIVGEAIIEWKARRKLGDIAISVRHIPFPEYTTSGEFLSTSFSFIPFFIVLGFLYPVAIFTKVRTTYSYIVHAEQPPWSLYLSAKSICNI